MRGSGQNEGDFYGARRGQRAARLGAQAYTRAQACPHAASRRLADPPPGLENMAPGCRRPQASIHVRFFPHQRGTRRHPGKVPPVRCPTWTPGRSRSAAAPGNFAGHLGAVATSARLCAYAWGGVYGSGAYGAHLPHPEKVLGGGCARPWAPSGVKKIPRWEMAGIVSSLDTRAGPISSGGNAAGCRSMGCDSSVPGCPGGGQRPPRKATR